MSRVMPRPASRCPRCLVNFDSTDLMLDHLNADHLTQTSSSGRVGAATSAAASSMLMSMSDAEVADLERAFRRPARPRHRRVSVIVAMAALLLIVCAVAVLG